MESGLLHDFLGNFPMQGERYYFHVQGVCEVRIVMQGEKCLHEVIFAGGGDILMWGHARWTQGEKLSHIHLM